MSYVYSRALVEAFLGAYCSAGKLFARSSLSPTPKAYCSPGKTMAFLSLSPYGMTFGVLTDEAGRALLTWYQEVFLVRTFRPLEEGPGSRASGRDSGRKWPGLLARWDRLSCSWKTSQRLLDGDLEEYSEIWPRWGLMRFGVCFRLLTPERRIGGKESGFLPTPTKSDRIPWGRTKKSDPRSSIVNNLNGGHQFQFIFVPLWNHSTPRQATELAEWMMGWPSLWTDLAPLEMDKFRQWLSAHGKN